MKNISAKHLALVLFSLTFQWSAFAQLPDTVPCGFPERSSGTPWNSHEFLRNHTSPSPEREVAAVREVLSGNVPEVLKTFAPLHFTATYRGQKVRFEMTVMPDYLMIGTNEDFVRMPLTNYAAQFLASRFGFVMPTPFLVDRIYEQANVKLRPQPTDWYKYPGAMRNGLNYEIFNETIETQRGDRFGLVAGHKKDVVLTHRLDGLPKQVAIYGWQREGNRPIQPLALPHDYSYEDYSHGIRFLGPGLKIVFPDGAQEAWSLIEALRDATLGKLLNGGQGVFGDVRAARVCDSRFMSALGLSGACPQQPMICR